MKLASFIVPSQTGDDADLVMMYMVLLCLEVGAY